MGKPTMSVMEIHCVELKYNINDFSNYRLEQSNQLLNNSLIRNTMQSSILNI